MVEHRNINLEAAGSHTAFVNLSFFACVVVPDNLPSIPTQIGKMAYGDVKLTHYMTMDDAIEFIGVSLLKLLYWFPVSGQRRDYTAQNIKLFVSSQNHHHAKEIYLHIFTTNFLRTL